MTPKLVPFLKDNKYGLSIFLILIFFIFSNSGQELDQDCICSYAIDYSTGFGGRKLIASFFHIFSKTLSIGRIRCFIFGISTLICAVFSWSTNKFLQELKQRGDSYFYTGLYITILYLVCPASTMFLLRYPNLGRLDFYFYGECIIFCSLFFFRNKNRNIYFTSTTILLILSILTHHIFVSTYLAFFVALFVYDIWAEGFNRQLFYRYLLIALVCISVFIIILSFSTMNISLDQAVHISPNFELSRKLVCFCYYAHISDHIQQFVIPRMPRLCAGFILSLLFIAPLIIIFLKIWRQLYLSTSNRATKRLIVGMQCPFLLFLPAFFITIDYPRWFGAFIYLQFLLLAYFLYDRSTIFSSLSNIIYNNLKQYVFYAALLVLYCSILDFYYSDIYFSGIEVIMEKLHIYRVPIELPSMYQNS